MATTIRVKTTAHYNGLPITILGDLRAGLVAVAGYGTPQELAIAAIAVKRRADRARGAGAVRSRPRTG